MAINKEIRNIIEQIATGNVANIRDDLSAVISERAIQALEQKKAKIAKGLIGESKKEPVQEESLTEEPSKESVEDYLKRGGSIKKGPTKKAKGSGSSVKIPREKKKLSDESLTEEPSKESVEDYLKRGGKVKTYPTKHASGSQLKLRKTILKTKEEN